MTNPLLSSFIRLSITLIAFTSVARADIVGGATFTLAPGTYAVRQFVGMSSSTPEASIRYTTDGSTPSETAGTLYVAAHRGRHHHHQSHRLRGRDDKQRSDHCDLHYQHTHHHRRVPYDGRGGRPGHDFRFGFWLRAGNGHRVARHRCRDGGELSDTQVVATVAGNAASGSARVRQSATWSNSVAFNVNTATIATVTPDSGVPGTEVTIAGSGFGAAQGSGQAWLGSANAVVQSWSDTQIVALVASGSASGNALVLQNGVMSNPIPFAVNTLQLTSIDPNSGAAETSVTFTGAGFGSSQSSGVVWLGSTAARWSVGATRRWWPRSPPQP